MDFEFGGSVLPTLYACDSWQKEAYLLPTINGDRPPPCIAISEPDAGSDVRSMKTTALRQGDDWILSGEKTWITHATYADYAIVLARTQDKAEPDSMTCFLVDRDMGWRSSAIPLMGCRDKVGSLYFHDVRVPERNVLGKVGKGLELAMGFIYRNRVYVISAKNIGTASSRPTLCTSIPCSRGASTP